MTVICDHAGSSPCCEFCDHSDPHTPIVMDPAKIEYEDCKPVVKTWTYCNTDQVVCWDEDGVIETDCLCKEYNHVEPR